MRENRLYGSVGGWGLNRPPPTQSFKAPRTGPHHVLEDPRLDKPRVQAPSFPLTIDKVWI